MPVELVSSGLLQGFVVVMFSFATLVCDSTTKSYLCGFFITNSQSLCRGRNSTVDAIGHQLSHFCSTLALKLLQCETESRESQREQLSRQRQSKKKKMSAQTKPAAVRLPAGAQAGAAVMTASSCRWCQSEY